MSLPPSPIATWNNQQGLRSQFRAFPKLRALSWPVLSPVALLPDFLPPYFSVRSLPNARVPSGGYPARSCAGRPTILSRCNGKTTTRPVLGITKGPPQNLRGSLSIATLWRGKPSGRSPANCRKVYGNYLMILVTRPEPTVRPPSRIAKPRPSSIAMG